jgi:GNAT superfamily N-acetyltransferase
MNAHLRLAALGDEQALAELNAFVQDPHVENEPSHFRPADSGEVASWFRGLIGDPEGQIWIVEASGKLVGYAYMTLNDHEEDPFSPARRWVEIDQIVVHPNYQRRGIGRSLIEHIIRTAHTEGIRDVELSSWSFNTSAHEAFQHLGFKPMFFHFGRESSATGK